MATYEETLATSVVMPVSPPSLTDGVHTVIWTSSTVTANPSYSKCRVFLEYEAIDPDTESVSPFDFEVQLSLEQLINGTWWPIGRTNQPMRKLEQGERREILCDNGINYADEGIDQVLPGLLGVPDKLKSPNRENSQGHLRCRMWVVDNDTGGSNPFVSVTASVRIQRIT